MLGLLWLLHGGCASRDPRFLESGPGARVWPPPPDAPRVRYLGELRGSAAVRVRTQSFLDRVLFGPDQEVQLITPQAVAVSGARVAVADPSARGVHVFDLEHSTFGLRKGEPDQGLHSATPVGVAWRGDTMFIMDPEAPGVLAFRGDSRVFAVSEGFRRPCSGAWNERENLLYVVDAGADCVVFLDETGRRIGEVGQRGAGPGQFNRPSHLACARDGRWAVSDSLNFRVQVFSADGSYDHEVGGKGDAAGFLALPKGVAFDADGNLWVVDAQFENIQAFDRGGRLLMGFGEEGRGPGQFWLPSGLCIDARDRMWVADTYNRRVQVFELIRS